MRSTKYSLLIALAAAGSVFARPQNRRQAVGDVPPVHAQDATGSNGAAAFEVAQCSEVAVDILKMGGNAADAMIAGALCTGTIASYHSGIGGGGFMLVRFPSNSSSTGFEYEMIDFRETMPSGGNVTMYSQFGKNETQSLLGGLSCGVPGELRAWEALYQRHGSGNLTWSQLFEPAINIARNGFQVNFDLANSIAGTKRIYTDPTFAAVYAINGSAAPENSTVYRPTYANTLQTVAKQGADAFYTGSIAQNIINTIHNNTLWPGIMTMEDLANYSVVIREPQNITYNGKRIFSTVAPSSGVVVLSALKIYEGYNDTPQLNAPGSNQSLHYLLEATEFAYGQRTQYGDPAFVPNVTELEIDFLQNATVNLDRSLISPNTTYPVTHYEPNDYYATRESGTSHMVVVDGTGMAISLTTTVNDLWGSQLMTPDGVILNDEMDDFSSPGEINGFGFAASPINYIAPGKRPQSSIASSIAEDLETGEFFVATGSAGGSRIITATIQQLHNSIDRGLNASECEHTPRWHDQLSGEVYFEYAYPLLNLPGYPNDTVAYINQTGYNVTYETPYGTSTSNIIVKLPNGMLDAASDPRRPAGQAAAY